MNCNHIRKLAVAVASFVAAFASAQDNTAPQGPGETVQRLATSADRELQQGVQQLNQLREQIAAEKLPMSQQLTAVEEQVGKQRRDYDEVARRVDAGNLEVANLKATMKARQDELAYVGNLLDEYARTFESKVHQSELQYCGEAIERAKQAGESNQLTLGDKLARQAEFVGVSQKRLQDAIGGMRFPGVGVDLQGSVVDGQYALFGPVAVFCSKAGEAGIVVAQTGSQKPLIRPLEGELQTKLAGLVQQGEGSMPLDPSLGGALKALVQKTNLIHIFEKGGPIMWPLLIASVLALATVLERLLFLMIEKGRRRPTATEEFFAAVEHGNLEAAVAHARGTKDFVLRVLGYAIEHRAKSLTNALHYAQARELKRFRRGIPVLDTVITLAPLLGLLGTVTGMMGSFSLIGGELSSPGAITGGIAEALIATAFGLGIAITALLPFNFLNARLDEATNEMQSAATQLELLVQGHSGAVPVRHHAEPLNLAAEGA